jgi:hypothetical protein
MDPRHEDMMAETESLFAIFAALACFMVIRAGFRKSQMHGIASASGVGLVLYLYFTVPAAHTFITIAFGIFLLIGLLQTIKENF